ncbi:hypothetical protein CQW23_16862 [Capsicum baccatum]|uniref:RNase H type-1 domain-containing protein n=1 Tax=Capsicum baccatum TaxID=33114 RepID=A0A2G2WC85_CAPBA|nr:hypothetical protein CQW23_16862 [Capsicum baccatum]
MRLFGMQGSYANVNNKIRLLWTSDFNINIIHDSDQSVNGRINHVTSGTDFHLSMVYAKCRSIQRKLSWEEIVNISENIQAPWSLTGDFNVIAEIEEKLGGSPYRSEKSFDFLDFMTDVGVQNTRFSGNIRYWCNKRDSPDTIWKRLDRMLYNTEWFDLFSKTSEIIQDINKANVDENVVLKLDMAKVKWLKPLISFIKVNSDDSYKEGFYRGGGMIRDHRGHFILAYSLNLGQGTSKWAEAKALLYGIEWCVANRYDMILVESDSKLLVDCVNEFDVASWRIQKEVEELKVHIDTTGYTLKHCFREANKVAGLLASLSFSHPHNRVNEDFNELPTGVKGLMTMDKWDMASLRISRRKKKEERSNMGSPVMISLTLYKFLYLVEL